MTDYTMAQLQVDAMKRQLAQLVREIVRALDDKNVTLDEGIMIGQRGLLFGMMLLSFLRGLPPEEMQKVLYVLEHGVFALPPTVGAGA